MAVSMPGVSSTAAHHVPEIRAGHGLSGTALLSASLVAVHGYPTLPRAPLEGIVELARFRLQRLPPGVNELGKDCGYGWSTAVLLSSGARHPLEESPGLMPAGSPQTAGLDLRSFRS